MQTVGVLVSTLGVAGALAATLVVVKSLDGHVATVGSANRGATAYLARQEINIGGDTRSSAADPAV